MANGKYSQNVTIRYPCNGDPLSVQGFPAVGTTNAGAGYVVYLFRRSLASDPTQAGSFTPVAGPLTVTNGQWVQDRVQLPANPWYLRATVQPAPPPPAPPPPPTPVGV